MSIKSDSFSSIILTKDDARKFRRQVTYGKPSAAAVESVRKGYKLASQYQKTGKVVLKIKEIA